ncbi:MAG: hypothetical protein HUJ53_11160 [Holdemanella sp.]|nr:hypothetical protein [Holdemanella sp.]
MKRLLISLFAVSLFFTNVIPVFADEEEIQEEVLYNPGWNYDENGWFYLDEHNERVTGWISYKGFWYYLGEDGYMTTGMIYDGEKSYIMDAEGRMLRGWIFYENNWYYGDSAIRYGWFNGYYLDPANNGAMAIGIRTIDDVEYYFNESGKRMNHGWVFHDNKWYYIEGNETKAIGWRYIHNKWYYFDENGIMVTGRQTIDDIDYFFDESGHLLAGWVFDQDDWYYTTFNGQVTDWILYKGCWYYLDPENEGKMVTGRQTIDDIDYFFDEEGHLLAGWVFDHDDWYYTTFNGQVTGWISYKGKQYYLDPENEGKMVTGYHIVDDKEYFFNEDGDMKTGWHEREENIWNYYESDGSLAEGWRKIKNTWYYFEDGIMVYDCVKEIDEEIYRFAKSGAMVTGWYKENEDWYYYKQSGAMAKGWIWDKDAYYYLYEDGKMARNTVIDGYHILENGKYSKARTYAHKLLESYDNDLYKAYKYCASMQYEWMTTDTSLGSEWFANYGFDKRTGNCYVMAACFYHLACAYGYEAHQISGKVETRNGYSIHSWVEVWVDGTKYICDPDFECELKMNGYMLTYGASGVLHYSDIKYMN